MMTDCFSARSAWLPEGPGGGSSGHACDEPGFFQGQHHLVDGGSGDLEMATHVGFGRGPFEDPAIGVDEGQVLALGLRKAGSRRRWAFVKCLTHFRFIRASTFKEGQLNIKFRVELSQSESDQLDALLSGGRHATRKIKRAQILMAANDGLSDEVIAATLKVSYRLQNSMNRGTYYRRMRSMGVVFG